MEKAIARTISFLLHPLIMTTLGLFLLFNSGSSLSVLQPEVKKISLIVTALFSFVFPASLIILLYLSGLISSTELHDRKERILPIYVVVIIYLVLLFIMRRVPQLTAGHLVFLSCPPVILVTAVLINRYMSPSMHMLGIGLLLGSLLVAILFYGADLQLAFILAIVLAGMLGTSRLILGVHTAAEVGTGLAIGFFETVLIMTVVAAIISH